MDNGRKVKTICTIGPSSDTPEILEQLVANGMDIARFNMSHAKPEEFLNRKKLIEEFNKKYNKNTVILADLQGPRVRVGEMPEEGMKITEGETHTFSTNKDNKEAIYIDDPYLSKDISVGEPIYLANGDMALIVTEKNDENFKAKVTRGGTLLSRKGVNVPDTKLTTRGLTDKDLVDLEFAVKNGAAYVAMSFVQDGEDLRILKEKIGNSDIKTISKIELKQAIINLEDILNETDLIMVARGDLGIELPLEELPLLQKYMMKQAGMHGVPSIVATQMLLSMTNSPKPTRAEVSDVANAVLDGAWAVMLSEETASGNYPVEALQYMIRIIERVEKYQISALPL